MSREFDRGLLAGSGSVDSKIWVLRKAYGEKAAVFAYQSRISNIAEIELCTGIGKFLGKSLGDCLEEPQIAVALIRDFVESTRDLGIPISVKELMMFGIGGESGAKEERQE